MSDDDSPLCRLSLSCFLDETRGVSDFSEAKKSKWKRFHFKPNTTYEEHMSNKYEQLTAQEWNSLILHFDSEAHDIVASHNKENCANKVGHHATGQISFQQLRNEIIEKEGAPSNVGDFYVRTRTSLRTNDIVDEASRAYIVQMKMVIHN